MCAMIAWASFGFVTRAWGIFEGSPEGDNGIPGVFHAQDRLILVLLRACVALQGAGENGPFPLLTARRG